jgi:hypothetical protein
MNLSMISLNFEKTGRSGIKLASLVNVADVAGH